MKFGVRRLLLTLTLAMIAAMPPAEAHGSDKQYLLLMLAGETSIRAVWTLKRSELIEIMGNPSELKKDKVAKLVSKRFTVSSDGANRALQVESVESAAPEKKDFVEVLLKIATGGAKNSLPFVVEFDFSGGDHSLSPMTATVIDASGKSLASHVLDSNKPRFQYPNREKSKTRNHKAEVVEDNPEKEETGAAKND